MPLVGSWKSANLLVRLLFRANIFSIFIRLFTNNVRFLFTVIAKTKSVCHCLVVYDDNEINQLFSFGDVTLYSIR